MKKVSLISMGLGLLAVIVFYLAFSGDLPFFHPSFEPLYVSLISLGATAFISGLYCLAFNKPLKKHGTPKLTLLSCAISATGAMGLVSFLIWYTMVAFHESSKHPISYPWSISLGFFCFLFFVLLGIVYCKMRSSHPSAIGTVLDILLSIATLPTFFFTFVSFSNLFL